MKIEIAIFQSRKYRHEPQKINGEKIKIAKK